MTKNPCPAPKPVASRAAEFYTLNIGNVPVRIYFSQKPEAPTVHSALVKIVSRRMD